MTEIARSTNEWQQADLDNYLHPFTDYKALLDAKALVITRGEGCYVWDNDNNRYLDGLAGLACVNIGYGRTELGQGCRRTDSGVELLQQLFQVDESTGHKVGRETG